ETALLGVLCQASGIATKAARCKKAAGERQVISFVARRMHPALAPMIERNAFVGGCDGVAVTKAAELIDADPTGTIPHALVLMIGDTVEALKAFHEVVDRKIRRLNPVVDGYGVGTSIANAPVVSFALDIMEIEGRPMAKRGKWSGAKDVFRRRGTLETVVVPAGRGAPRDGAWDPLLKPLLKAGRLTRDLPPPRTIRDYVLEQLAPVSLDTLRRQGQRRDF